MKPIVILSIFLFSVCRLSADENWVLTNGPYGALNFALAVSSDGDIFTSVYFNSQSQGIYKSSDNGETWEPVGGTIDMPVYDNPWVHFQYLKFDSGDNLFYSIDSLIFVSTDKGDSWSDLVQILKSSFPSESYALYPFMIADSIFINVHSMGLFKLSGERDEWVKIIDKDYFPDSYISSLQKDNNENYYIKVHNKSTKTTGLYMSTDFGNSWELIDTNINYSFYNHPDGSFLIVQNGSLFVADDILSDRTFVADSIEYLWMDNDGTLFRHYEYEQVGYEYWDMKYKVSISTNKGLAWSYFYTQEYCDFSRGFVQENKNNVYYATDNRGVLIKSEIEDNWKRKTIGFEKKRINQILPISADTVYVANVYGLYKTQDKGQKYNLLFPKCTTYNDTPFNDIFKIPGRGISGNLIDRFFSFDEAEENVLINYSRLDDVSFNSKGEFFKVFNYNICKSTDFGETWDTLDIELSIGYLEPLVLQLHIDDKDNYFIVINRRYIFKSTDGGETYYKTFPKFDNGPSINKFISNGSVICAFGSYSDKLIICISFDNGETWEETKNNLNSENNYSYTLSRNGDLFAGEYGIDSKGLLKSTDYGSTWEEIELDIPDNRITAVAIDEKGHVWIGNKSGNVYYSKAALTSNKPNSVIQDRDSYINIYPNPANDQINIVFINSIDSGNAEITLTDLFGRVVLSDKYIINSGRNNIKIDIGNVESGACFIILRNGNNSTVKPIIIQR